MRIARFRSPAVALTMAWALMVGPAAAQQPPPAPPAPVLLPPGFGNTQAPPPPKPAPEAKPAAPEKNQAEVVAAVQAAPSVGGLNLVNANLVEVIDYLARQLKLNYMIDKRVSGAVTLNTYGETKDINPRELLDTILRINGAAMVQAGAIWRIVPLAELSRMPLRPVVDPDKIPEDDRPMLNLVFLKYANVEEITKLLSDFLGPEGRAWAYMPANLLLVLDSRRNMSRTMDLVALFDSDALAKQRVRIFDVKNSRPSVLVKDLEALLKSVSLSKELSSVKFVAVDRINTIIAVAPNPGAFAQVEEWLNKLDIKVQSAADQTDTYVYRVKYQRAELLAMSIMQLYGMLFGGGWGFPGMGFGGMGFPGMGFPAGVGFNPMGMGMGMGGMGMGGLGMGMGGLGMGMGGMGMGGLGMGMGGLGMGMGGLGMGMGGWGGMGMGGMGMGPMAMPAGSGVVTAGGGAAPTGTGGAAAGQPADQTGAFLGAGGMAPGMGGMMRGPRVIPNFLDNSLMILATPEEYEGIMKLLRELDIPPRQVLIEARIFEVQLTGAFANGVSYFLQNRGVGPAVPMAPTGTGRLENNRLSLSAGTLLGESRELLAFLTAQSMQTRTRIISAPSVIATDSIPANINVGIDVPMLTAQAVTGAIAAGASLFANTITNRRTGVNLAITARVNPTGIVTLEVNQEVSAPQAPAVGGIQSPSFSQRSIQTQVTVRDGDLVAIGGIIQETDGVTSAGIPGLHRIPIIGYAFGDRSRTRTRTELVVFFTPRVIYDTNELVEAGEDLVGKMRRLQRLIRE
jgi:general secretion pathway protein D